MINTVVLDLDGTLLNSKGEISKFNKEIIFKLKENGVNILIATGRIYKATSRYKEELKLETPIICYNGSMVIDGKTDMRIDEITVDNKIVKEVISIAREFDVHLNLFQDENWYIETNREEAQIYKELSGLKYHILDFEDLEINDITKLMYIGDHEKLIKINGLLEEKFGNKIYKAFSKPHFLEILNSESSKGKTLKKVLDKKGINLKNVMAFGDNYNDLEMLENVGLGVLMKNAPEGMHEKIKIKTKTNDEDGVGIYLKEYFNLS
ncbi:MAG: Cof-type HAD-IIB family hydrolase [Fusobacteriota bacterium]